MASRRIEKKKMKGLLKVKLKAEVKELEALNKQISDIDAEIAKARKLLKKKKATLSELQDQIMKVESYKNPVLNKLYSAQVNYAGKGKRYDDEGSTINNDGVYGAILKKYYEYVDKGWIKRVSTLDKYEAAQWFAENIMSKEDMQEAINQADAWREAEEEKHQRSLAARVNLIDF